MKFHEHFENILHDCTIIKQHLIWRGFFQSETGFRFQIQIQGEGEVYLTKILYSMFVLNTSYQLASQRYERMTYLYIIYNDIIFLFLGASQIRIDFHL